MSVECLRCRVILVEDYQLIFDETGIELQLNKLLAEHFGIKIEEDSTTSQALCEECVTKLIELYDLTQREVELQSNAIETNKLDTQEFQQELVKEEEEFKEDDFENDDGDSNEEEDIIKEDNDNSFEIFKINDGEIESNDFEYEEVDFKSLVPVQNGEELLGFSAEDSAAVECLDGLEGGITPSDYVRKAIKSDLEIIECNQTTVCMLCQEVMKSHTAVIMHILANHEAEDKTYSCIFCSADGFHSTNDLSHHIVLRHYDIETITIYCTCPECKKRFANFMDYNKHSCFKGNAGSRLLQNCAVCSKEFISNKRYRFHLQFHLEKQRPKACFICDIFFSNENEFFEHIMYAHEKEDKLVCKKCDRISTSKELYDSHMKIHDAVRSFQCQYCSRTYLYKQMLTNHIKRQHTDKDCYQCKVCMKTLASKHILTRHMQLKHSAETEESVYICSLCGLVEVKKDAIQEHIEEYCCSDAKMDTKHLQIALACEFCENAYESVENLNEHRKIHVKNCYICWICKSEYSEFKNLKTHILTHTTVPPIQKTFPVNRHYVCDYDACNQTYLTWPSLRAHKQRHASHSKFTCDICCQVFRNQTILNHHQRTHCQNEKYTCQFCAKMCPNQMSLAVHIARKHNNNSISCSICHSTYATEEALQEHVDKHHVELTCQLCGKVTKNKRNFETHVSMVHAKVKRFFCPTCDKGYYNNSDLKVHVKAVHSELNKYKCKHCEFTSSYESSFNAHLLLHETKKPFKCEECSKEFTRKMCYKLHLLRHSDVRPFSCPIEDCGRSFVTRGILNSHMRDNHSGPKGKIKKALPRATKRKNKNSTQLVYNSKQVKYELAADIQDTDTVDSIPVELAQEEEDMIFYVGGDNDIIEDLYN